MLLMRPPHHTRAQIAYTRNGQRLVPVYYHKPKKIGAAERTTHDPLRNRMVKDLRAKGGETYAAALKWVTQMALPRIEGTLSRARIHLARRMVAAGMTC